MFFDFAEPPIFLLGLLFLASVWDMLTRKVPNFLIFPGIFFGFFIAISSPGAISLSSAIYGFMLGFSFFLIPYLYGGMGAADLKIMAMVGCYIGPLLTFNTGVYAIVVCGIYAVFYALRKGILLSIFSNSIRLKKSDAVLPYAPAILLGVILTYLFPFFK